VDDSVSSNGFAVIPRVFNHDELRSLLVALSGAGKEVYAIRNLLETFPAVQDLAAGPKIRALVNPVLGRDAFPVRGILFDKTPDANWKVPWHQDLSIAVQERLSVDGFGPWSVKAGVVHVQPPREILEAMLAVRIHLDDCDAANGPVRVIPGSHLNGRLRAEEVQGWAQRIPSVQCPVPSGGVMLMRPLLLHASSAATTPAHRRVIHLEFASTPLPGKLRWFAGIGS
jgi:ectoine hydroxylase-related dioxygenase (phytanoyl-CoA dioxygenase family)